MNKPIKARDVTQRNERARALIESAQRTLEAEGEGIAALAAAVRDGLGAPFVAAVDLISEARGRVIVTGMGKSGHVGRKVAATFASTGTPAFFVHPSEASHGDLGMITPDDVILALSWSGETVELKDLIDYSRRFSMGLIAVTANADSALAPRRRRRAARADGARSLSAQSRADHLHADAAGARRRARRRAPAEPRLHGDQFGIFHPGGRLGTRLKFVRDVMHKGDAMPLTALGARMSDAIVEMSAKGFGCVGITDHDGRLVGIITDGDSAVTCGPTCWRPRSRPS